jgi:hypothetical protein
MFTPCQSGIRKFKRMFLNFIGKFLIHVLVPQTVDHCMSDIYTDKLKKCIFIFVIMWLTGICLKYDVTSQLFEVEQS